MSASKELLTDILDGITMVQHFLQELSQEKLSHGREVQRQASLKAVQGIMKKIQHSHPSIRPRVNTPATMKKPPLPPPAEIPGGPPTVPEEEHEGEVYEEPATDIPAEAEDYLSFEPAQTANGLEESQEMYEAMEVTQEVYEEPVSNPALPGGSQEDVDQGEQNYEDPVASRPSTASLPPPSQENSGSGAEYAEAVIRRGPENAIDMSMDWGNVYTLPSKGEKMKVSELKNVLIRGYLEKLGGRKQKDWQKRYCVLSGSLMYFYEKENSKTYNNCIALQAFTTSGAENLTHAKRSHFAFKMTHRDNTGKNKDYYFRTNSEDTREKWLKSIGKVVNSQSPSTPTSRPPSASTLPRHMPSQVTSSTFLPDPSSRKRASSLQEEGEEGELYEDMAIPEETEDLDEYVPVSPTPNQGEESGEEYVDVMTQNDIEQEEYEDTTNFQQPPPPLSPPPGPPSEFFTPPVVAQPQQVPPPKAPALVPPPSQDIPIDTNRIYDQPNGSAISLEKVFVSLWDFAASEEDELALSRGDLVYVSSPKETAEWWFGELLDPDASHKLGQVGFFPRTYSTAAFTPVA